MIKLIASDLDGTLLNTIDDLADAANWVCARHGWPLHTVEEYKRFVGNGIPRLVERFAPAPERTPEGLARALEEFSERYGAHRADKTAPYAGMPEAVERLRAAGVRTAVLSNKAHALAGPVVEDYYPGQFPWVQGALPGLPTKPDPTLLHRLMEQMGASLLEGESLALDHPAYRRVWQAVFEPAVRGGYAIYDGYSSDLSKTGEIVCSTGSTAGILFYGDQITYPDNTTEQVEYTVLPFPTFEGGKKIAIQRGNGLVVARSTPEKEQAAVLFLKWFTQPEQNMRFVASTGYLPVTKAAFENSMDQEIATNENVNIQKLLRTAVQVYSEYEFYIPPVFDSFNALRSSYEADFLTAGGAAREEYCALLETTEPDAAYEAAVQGRFEAFTGR